MSNIIDQIEKENMKENVGQFNIGDTVRVGVKIKEGDKERIQAFEGVVIARKNEQNYTMLEILLVKLQKSNLLTTNKNYHNFSHLLLKLAEY